jgi:tryptophanyl-tRNA synthetase
MHKAVSPEADQKQVYENCTGAKWGCVDCKKVLFDNFNRELVPLRAKREALPLDQVKKHLKEGADKARITAEKTMAEVRDVMGVGSGG